MRGRQEQIGLDVEAAIGRCIRGSDVILVPGEDSSTGNVTGGRKLARYVLDSRTYESAGRNRF